jgi:hypothetical protein
VAAAVPGRTVPHWPAWIGSSETTRRPREAAPGRRRSMSSRLGTLRVSYYGERPGPKGSARACAAKCFDQRLIHEWMGHQTEEMRRRYRHLIPNQQHVAIRTVFG